MQQLMVCVDSFQKVCHGQVRIRSHCHRSPWCYVVAASYRVVAATVVFFVDVIIFVAGFAETRQPSLPWFCWFWYFVIYRAAAPGFANAAVAVVTAVVAASVAAYHVWALVSTFAGVATASRSPLSIAGGTVDVDLLMLAGLLESWDSRSPCCFIVDGGGSAEVLEELPLPLLRWLLQNCHRMFGTFTSLFNWCTHPN